MISSGIGILAIADDLIRYAQPQPLFEVAGAVVTNLDIMAVVAAVLVVATFYWVGTRVRVRGEGQEAYITHGAAANLFEVVLVFIREEVVRPNLGKLTDKYIYYIWTVFFFVLFANVLGIIPIGEFLQFFAVLFGAQDPAWWGAWGGTATSTLSLNAPLAFVSLVAIVGIGIRENGRDFFAHFAPVPFKPLGMLPIAVMITVLEVIGLLVRCVVLAMRLFGTMIAGHMVIVAIVGMIFVAAQASVALGFAVILPVLVGGLAVMILELFIMVLQAFIFAFLTTLFIAAGAVHHEGEHEQVKDMEGAASHDLADEGAVTAVGKG